MAKIEITPTVAKRLARLARKQMPPTSRTRLVGSILGAAVEACDADENPEAWRRRLDLGRHTGGRAARARPG